MNKEKKYAYIITYDNEEPYEDNYSYTWSVAFTTVEAAEECVYEEGYTRKYETFYTLPLYTQKEVDELLKLKDKDGRKMFYAHDFTMERYYNKETDESELLGYRLFGFCTIKAVSLLESINELGEMDIHKY